MCLCSEKRQKSLIGYIGKDLMQNYLTVNKIYQCIIPGAFKEFEAE